MPTVLRAHGFVIKIHFNDHAPAHVHVLKTGAEAIITLDPVMVLRIWRMSRSDVAKATDIVNENNVNLLSAWKTIHGQ